MRRVRRLLHYPDLISNPSNLKVGPGTFRMSPSSKLRLPFSDFELDSLHNGTTSIGIVMHITASNKKKATPKANGEKPSLTEHYLDQLQYAPGLKAFFGEHAEFIPGSTVSTSITEIVVSRFNATLDSTQRPITLTSLPDTLETTSVLSVMLPVRDTLSMDAIF